MLPAFVCFDGFILSHTYEPVDMISQEDADKYLPKFTPKERLDAADPISFGMYATPEYYLEFRYETDKALKDAKAVIRAAGAEFGKMFGRDYSTMVEGYQLEDAETVIVAMGSICGTVKDTIDDLRAEGKKVGLLKIRVFRPFPSEDVAKALKGAKHVAVLDKNISLGAKGAVALEVKDALYGSGIRSTIISLALAEGTCRRRTSGKLSRLAGKGKGDQFIGLRREVL